MHSSKYTDEEKHILSSLFLKELDIAWGLLKYVSTLGTGTLVAWYFIRDDFRLSNSLLILSSFFLLLILLLMRRHTILMERYRLQIYSLVTSPGLDIKEPNSKPFGFDLRGHTIQRLFPYVLIIVNLILVLISSLSELYYFCCSFTLSMCSTPIAFILLVFMGISFLLIFFKQLINDPLYNV